MSNLTASDITRENYEFQRKGKVYFFKNATR